MRSTLEPSSWEHRSEAMAAGSAAHSVAGCARPRCRWGPSPRDRGQGRKAGACRIWASPGARQSFVVLPPLEKESWQPSSC